MMKLKRLKLMQRNIADQFAAPAVFVCFVMCVLYLICPYNIYCQLGNGREHEKFIENVRKLENDAELFIRSGLWRHSGETELEKQFCVGIISVPRAVNYLEMTVASLLASMRRPHIAVVHGSAPHPVATKLFQAGAIDMVLNSSTPQTLPYADRITLDFISLVDYCFQSHEYMLMLEDDAVAFRGFWPKLEEILAHAQKNCKDWFAIRVFNENNFSGWFTFDGSIISWWAEDVFVLVISFLFGMLAYYTTKVLVRKILFRNSRITTLRPLLREMIFGGVCVLVCTYTIGKQHMTFPLRYILPQTLLIQQASLGCCSQAIIFRKGGALTLIKRLGDESFPPDKLYDMRLLEISKEMVEEGIGTVWRLSTPSIFQHVGRRSTTTDSLGKTTIYVYDSRPGFPTLQVPR